MALTAQHTQVWKARLEALTAFILPVFFQALCNTHYQGELSANKTLNLVSYGSINTGDYTGAAITFQTPATTGDTFTLDQLKYFAFTIDDKDQYGSLASLIENFSKNAIRDVNILKDGFIAGLHTNVTSNVVGSDATPLVVGFDTTIGEVLPSKALAMLYQQMGQNNADLSSPNIVLPTWYGAALAYELGTRYTGYGDLALKTGIAPGKIEQLSGISGYSGIFVSNNVDTVGAGFKIMAGTPDSAITFAQGVENVESGRHIDYFGTYVKGLHIYGAKVVDEKHMGLLTASKGSWAPGVPIV